MFSNDEQKLVDQVSMMADSDSYQKKFCANVRKQGYISDKQMYILKSMRLQQKKSRSPSSYEGLSYSEESTMSYF